MSQELTIREAVDSLEGHGIITPALAKQICQLLEVPFEGVYIMRWQTSREAFEKYGFFSTQNPGEGVDALRLSYRIAEALGLGQPGASFSGVGFQSRANQQAIRRKLSEMGKL